MCVFGVLSVVLFFAFQFISPEVTFAQSADTFGLEQIDEPIVLDGGTDIRVVIAKIIRAVLGLLGIIALSIILYAGFTIMTSGGDDAKVLQGRKILTNGVIGLVIILSSFAIVQYILNKLSVATGLTSIETPSEPTFNTFAGSGALGSIIEDHYPGVGDTGISRNAKIFVTFAEPIDPSTVVENTNNTCWPIDTTVAEAPQIGSGACLQDASGDDIPYFGDCSDINGNGKIDWDTDCDQALSDSVIIKMVDEPKDEFTAAGLATYNADREAFTFVFRPSTPLGTLAEDIWHSVRLTNDIEKILPTGNQQGIFETAVSNFYQWEFQTNTEFDFDPPRVVSTYPKAGTTIPRNSILQITFNEPMDPTGVQGVFEDGNAFYHVPLHSPALDAFANNGKNNIEGSWQITNGYKTIEFTSNLTCGQNSCGDEMYCFPSAGDAASISVNALVRTAELLPGGEGFESIPFTGAMDAAGNALDNGPGNIADGIVADPHKPSLPATDFRTVNTEVENTPDNFWWNFVVENKIDSSVPFLNTITPGIDQQQIAPKEEVRLGFSKPMVYKSLKKVSISEYPGPEVSGVDTLSFNHAMTNSGEAGNTSLEITHRVFGPNGLDLYYMPTVPSEVKSLNQQCLYPGFGPGGAGISVGDKPTCEVTFNDEGLVVSTTGCVDVNKNANTDTGCASSVVGIAQGQADTDTCLQLLEAQSPSTLLE